MQLSKKAILLLVFVLIVCSNTITYVALSTSNQTTIGFPNLVGEADYFLVKSGSTYYAINGLTRNQDYSSTIATTVFDWIVSALSSDSLKMVSLIGEFTLTSDLTPSSNFVLDLRNAKIIMGNDANNNMIHISSVNNIIVLGGVLDGNYNGQTSGSGICIDGTSDNIQIYDTEVFNTKHSAFRIDSTDGIVLLQNVKAHDSETGDGVTVIGSVRNVTINLGTFYNNLAENGAGIYLESQSGSPDAVNILGIRSFNNYYGVWFNTVWDCSIRKSHIYSNLKYGLYVGTSQFILVSEIYFFGNSKAYTNLYDDVLIYDSDYVSIIGITTRINDAIPVKWGIEETGTSNNNMILGCYTQGGTTGGGIRILTSDTKVRTCYNGSLGWVNP